MSEGAVIIETIASEVLRGNPLSNPIAQSHWGFIPRPACLIIVQPSLLTRGGREAQIHQ